jgi:competence protein ComEC
LKPSLRIILILFLLNLLIWGFFFRPKAPLLAVTFLDVGKGDSIFINFPHGGDMLIDGGSGGQYNSGRKIILPYLRREGIKKIDVVVLTHPHSDHIGGLMPVIEKMKVGLIIDSGQPHTSFMYKDFLELADKKDIPFHVARDGEKVTGFRGVDILILNPPVKAFAGTESDLNNNSLVMKIIFNQVNFLFCGDIEVEAEERLTGYGALLNSEIIKVPHHGSSASVYSPFLNLVNPETGIISCGYKSIYGHPHRKTLKAYKKLNAKIYRTDKDGAITIISDGSGYSVKTMINDKET